MKQLYTDAELLAKGDNDIIEACVVGAISWRVCARVLRSKSWGDVDVLIVRDEIARLQEERSIAKLLHGAKPIYRKFVSGRRRATR